MVPDRGAFIDYHNSYTIYPTPGANVIDFIDFSVRCTSFDEALSMLSNLGPEVLVARLDIKKALMLFPVHEHDFH